MLVSNVYQKLVAMGCPGLRLALLGSCNVTDESIKALTSRCKLEVLTLNKCGM